MPKELKDKAEWVRVQDLLDIAREHHQKAKETYNKMKGKWDEPLDSEDSVKMLKVNYESGARDALLQAAGKKTTYFEDKEVGK